MTTSPAGIRTAANGQTVPAFLPVSIGHLWFVQRMSDGALAAYDHTAPSCLPGDNGVRLDEPSGRYSARAWHKASLAWTFIEDKLPGRVDDDGDDLSNFFPQRKD